MMKSEAILNERVQIGSSAEKLHMAIPLRSVIKEVIIHLYRQGVLPKAVTQKLFDSLQIESY